VGVRSAFVPPRSARSGQAYYQAHLFAAVFLQPIASYIPSPGAAVARRLAVLFQESVHE
jgi:carbohydrate-selective porin OprB